MTSVRDQFFVGGRWIDAGDHARHEVVNPADRTPLGGFPIATAEDVDAAVTAASAAYADWRRHTPGERSRALLDLAAAMERDIDTLVDLESANVGKPKAGARAEIAFAIDHIRFCAGAARSLEASSAGEYIRGQTSVVRREPLGVVAQIAPWNYPMVMLAYKLGPALATGNTTVFKPAEQTPLTTLRVAELADGILPLGTLNVLTGDGTTGSALVRHPGVRMVSLTGDSATGRTVAREAADSLKRVHLELGGKAPVLVFDDADIEHTVSVLRRAAFYNSGQDCTEATRILVDRRIAGQIVDGLVEAVRTIRVGDPAVDGVEMGPLVSGAQHRRVSGFVDRLGGGEAKILTGGASGDERGFFYQPTVVTGVSQHDEIVQREVFGPVVTVQTFDSEQEAVELANGTPYGLAASVWTKDAGRAMEVSGLLECGAVWVNEHDVVTPEMPHGGAKASGYGKDLSVYSVLDYTLVKHVMINHRRS
ncbi:aminobutyraldehyde dehydrogenase [Sinosporangium siamense]|uniref:Salicylaldehyde dehydrogenase n=1 Tax=Sinosporangium siamense TaxID=1367973 RepID=A0A919RML1_9ACTN|nr:aminobutyraldehyde dehydrogenase [Sinosporangium siamense]GII95204.1 gamma-aminobutyraldehyde dehydrogenase [Sinosporangium siamense]